MIVWVEITKPTAHTILFRIKGLMMVKVKHIFFCMEILILFKISFILESIYIKIAERI